MRNLARKAKKILGEELKGRRIICDSYEVRVYDVSTAGVQGDASSRTCPVEISLVNPIFEEARLSEEKLYSLLEKVGGRIPNEVKGVNRVVYVVC